MPLHGVEAMVFDTFGTVVDWRAGVIREAGPFLAAHGVAAAEAGAFADAWRARYLPSMREVRHGRRPFVRLDVLHHENLLAILPTFGIDPAAVASAELANLNRAWHRLDPWPDAIPGLVRLKTGFIIAPHSNGNIALLTNMAKRAGLPWDAILGAEAVKAYKPDPKSYLRTAEILGLEPRQVCMTAAHNADLAAARRCGLATAYVTRPDEFGPGGAAEPPAEPWDVVATDFCDLARQLGL